MSGKSTKRERREVKKQMKKAAEGITNAINSKPFLFRLRYAWKVLTKKL